MANALSVLFLNMWGPRYPEEGLRLAMKPSTPHDIICFTEVTHLKSPLPQAKVYQDGADVPTLIDGHRFFTNHLNTHYEHRFDATDTEPWICARTQATYHNVGYGSSLFWRRRGSFTQSFSGAVPINTGHPHRGVRTLQWVVILREGVRYLIAHLHGVWIEGNTKGDSAERLKQSKLVRTELDKLMRKMSCRKLVFGGDLNLALNTEALKRLEGVDNELRLQNLIRDDGIESTRTRHYRRHGEGSQHADYVFVSGDVQVHSFEGDTNFTGSDHAPLMVTFT